MAVPILPFLIAGPWIENWISAALAALGGRPLATALAVVAALGADILLPVPGSAVATLAGQTLGPSLAISCVWSGLMLSAAMGFEATRRFGRPMAERLCSPEELAAHESRFREWGAAGLVITRPIPILADACILWAGLQGFPRRRFYAVMAVANTAVAVVFVMLGWVSSRGEFTGLGLLISVLVPLLLAVLLTRRRR
ncbi:VTT domain-containing protein [Candidatus Laterigemmans baculatus]|uniref:VTT domain-containing protein n=1 Tax=Candidatus Laterigemmans baculatus TaxID=2770505 RepID=UPI0013DCB3AC|nr:VTT domain-containing protein [Candidatus Laterigemmans baculatus]